MTRFFNIGLLLLWVFLPASYAVSAVYFPNGNTSSLISNILSALSSSSDDIIDLGGKSYLFTSSYDGNNALPIITSASGKLSIINGTLERSFSLTSATPFRLIQNQGTLILANITLENGYSANGGGILNTGILEMYKTTISSSTATSSGGGIENDGTITLMDSSIIANNFASSRGAGIYNTGTIDAINRSTINSNSMQGSGSGNGGGIYNGGTIVSITANAITSNKAGATSAGCGGGIANFATIGTIANNTISNNSTHNGGGGSGICMPATTAVINSIINNTITGNTGSTGIVNDGSPSSAIHNLASNIIAGNTSLIGPSDIFNSGVLTNGGHNLFSTAPIGTFTLASTDIVQTNAATFLGPVQDNGGPTFTKALLPGSLAINNGSNPASFIYDQRGQPFKRILGGAPDIGAFELGYVDISYLDI